jgi:sugar O-acyltransferase (sialic acid O-acetyltransferase NeuD family)
VFFDDVNADAPSTLYNRFPVITSATAAKAYLAGDDKRFILAIGGTNIRKQLAKKINALGGILHSVISNNAYISQYGVQLETGLNIMQRVIIQPSVKIGKGTLVNVGTIIHHDSIIGAYCEICPAVTITGRCSIGNYTFVGTGAILTPGVNIGNNVIVGAGAVVTKDVGDGLTVVGIPARSIIKK